MSTSYNILETTSIFAQDRRAVSYNSGQVQDPTPVVITPVVPRGNTPIFRASMIDDNGPLVMLEVLEFNGNLTYYYYRVGQTLEWNKSQILRIDLDKMQLSRASATGFIEIPLGYNIDGYSASAGLPNSPTYQSNDALGQTNNQNTGGGGRGGRGGGGGGGGFAGGNFGGGGGGGGRGGGGFGGGGTAGGMATSIINPMLDPPLPGGSTDDIAARMAQRRNLQLNSTTTVTPTTPAPAAPTTPAATPTTPTPATPGAIPVIPAPATPAPVIPAPATPAAG